MFKKDNIFFILIMAFALIIWSSSFTFIRVALGSFSPESLALLRFLVASIFLFIYSRFKKFSLPDPKDLPVIAICGFVGITLYHIALNHGEITVKAGSASMLLNTYPIFVAILSSLFLREYVNFTKWTGILISFGGIALIALGESGGFNLSPGIFLILIAAISNSLYDVMQKKLLRKYTPLELTSYFMWIGTFFLMFFSRNLYHDLQTATISSTLSVIYLGIFPGAIAYLIWAKALSQNSVTNISSLFYTLPFLAIIIAFIILKEIPASSSLIGGAVGLIGVLIVNFSNRIKQTFSKAIDALPHY